MDADSTIAMSLPLLRPEVATDSFTLTACYCPNYDGPVDATPDPCDHRSEFIQPIGIIYYWTVKICDVDDFESCGVEGNPPFMRILPQHPFALRLMCPPGGTSCSPNSQNRVKFLPELPPPNQNGQVIIEDPERAIWEPQARCKVEFTETDEIQWDPPPAYDDQGNLVGILDAQGNLIVAGEEYKSGGDRRDYKVWHTPSLVGVLFMEGVVEVCYCDTECDEIFNYFKVGEILVAASAGVARWTKDLQESQGASIQPIESVQFVTKPGALTLYAGLTSNVTEGMHPYDSIPWRRKSCLKIISLDGDEFYTPFGGNDLSPKVTLEKSLRLDRQNSKEGRAGLDFACANSPFNGDNINGPSSADNAKEFMAWVGPGPSKHLPFSGLENDQSFNFLKSGTYIICYCSVLNEQDLCADNSYYISAARLLVKGPRGGHVVELPTSFVVRIDLEGWGFTDSDSIRLISMTQTCMENANDPKGVSGYRLGCPGVNGSSCRAPEVKEDIAVHVISADRTQLYITSIEVGDTLSYLTFSGDITSELLDGDAITMDETSVLLGGKNYTTWTATEHHLVAMLSSFYGYADEPEEKRMLWNRVSYLPMPGGGFEKRRLSIPIGWPEGHRPDFSFIDDKGRWSRRNRLQTEEEIKADREAEVKICWGANDLGRQQYYGEAGVLSFVSPNFMSDAGVYLTSRLQGSIGPVIISFSPRRGRTFYKEYNTPIVVRILFKDVNGMLEPLLAGEPEEDFSGLESLPSDSSVDMDNATQSICGMLFMEMWTNDDAGFPFPRGCYYGPLYTDMQGDDETERPSYREFFIIFEPQAGLKDICTTTDQFGTRQINCVYQLVMNARVGSIDQFGPELVGIYTQCAGKSGYATVCGPRYSVLEYGQARPVFSTMAFEPNNTEIDRVEILPLDEARRLNSYGLRGASNYQRSKILELKQTTTFPDADITEEAIQFGLRAWTKDPLLPIERGGRLKIFLKPLTLWDVSRDSSCQATTKPAPGLSADDGRGGEQADCSVEPIVKTDFEIMVRMQRNTFEIGYPTQMDEIPPGRSDEAHLIEISAMLLPNEGFFPTRMLAQYTGQFGDNPSVVLVSPLTKRVPVHGTTTGRIVVEGQTGNGPRPFVFQKGNTLIVRLTMGVTLQSPPLKPDEDDNETAAEEELGLPPKVILPPMVQIILPPDYTCSVVGNGTADPDGTNDIFSWDLDDDGYIDNPMGTLFSGSWTASGQICTYTLETYASLYAGQIFYVRLSVDNPRQFLLRDDPTNVWQIRIAGMDNQVLGGPVPFVSLAEEVNFPGWCGNLAVIMPLEGESLTPSNLSAGAYNNLNVFFQAIHSMPKDFYIILDAPAGFDFTDNCSVGHADDEYYEDWEGIPWGGDQTGPRSLTSSLGDDVNCTTDNWQRSVLSPPPTENFTRAQIRVGRTLISGKYYAFTIHVHNARQFDIIQHDEWRLFIQSPERYMVDGSRYTIQFNAARIDSLPPFPHDRSWGIYQEPMRLPLALDFGSTFLTPTSMFDMNTKLTVYPLTPSSDGQIINIRMVAPVGYVWTPDAVDGWSGEIPDVTCSVCKIYATPVVEFFNELLLPDSILRVGRSYGFMVRLRIPDRPPTRSSNVFYLEMGYDPRGLNLDRMQAVMLPAPKLRVIHRVSVFSLCNVASFADNVMEFHLTIPTPLGINSGFLFSGDELTRGTMLRCWPEALTEPVMDKTNGQCNIFDHKATLLPQIMLYATGRTFPSGKYIFRFRGVVNPAQPAQKGAFWNFGTYQDLHIYPMHKILDKDIDVPVPTMRGLLLDAGIVNPPEFEAPGFGRDDGPLRTNYVSFFFRVQYHPEFPSSVTHITIALRGPPGFLFEEDCMDGLQAFGFLNKDAPNRTTGPNWACSIDPRTGRLRREQTSWCPHVIRPWPQNLEPSSCLGFGNTAQILVPNSIDLETASEELVPRFEDGMTFAFRIKVLNPNTRLREGSSWALDFGSEASTPFQSMQVRTFDREVTMLEIASKVVVQPLFQTIAQQYLPFRLDFMPSILVPAPRRVVVSDGRLLQGGTVPFGPEAEEGSLVLQAPNGFMFRIGDFDSCQEESLEHKGRDPWDEDGLFTSREVECKVSGDNLNTMTFTLINEKDIVQGILYTIEGTVRNPDEITWPGSQDWLLESYKRFVATNLKIRLDSIVLPGITTIAPAVLFWIDNDSREYTGNTRVMVVNMSMRFEDALRNGDNIRIEAPLGFDLSNPEDNRSCMHFTWPGNSLILPDSPPPTCICDRTAKGPKCRLTLTLAETALSGGVVDRQEVLLRKTMVSFAISMVNPPSQPHPVDDWWKGELWAGGPEPRPLAVGIRENWPVYGVLGNISTELVGTNTRAGATSDLQITFISSVWGTTLTITFHEPEGFDFDLCRPNAPLLRDERTSGNHLILSNGIFLPGQTSVVALSRVRLGLGGGPTRISLQLYADREMTKEVARRLNFLRGFRLPGAVEFNEQRLWSLPVVQHYSGEHLDAVSPLLPCHTDRLARFEIFVRFSRHSLEGDFLTVMNQAPFGEPPFELTIEEGYEPSIEACLTPSRTVTDNGTWLCNDTVQLSLSAVELIRNSVGVPEGIRLTLARMPIAYVLSQESLDVVAQSATNSPQPDFRDMALEPHRDYRLRIWLRATTANARWRITTEDEKGFTTNTNDALTEAIIAVPEMTLTAATGLTRNPPESAVYVRITVTSGNLRTRLSKLQLLLPYGFAPSGVEAVDGSRMILALDMDAGSGTLEEGMVWDVRLTTPYETNLDPRWFVLGKTVIFDEITGAESEQIVSWGSFEGFGVQACPVSLNFGSIPSATGWMALSFYLPKSAGGVLVLVTAPETFGVACPQEDPDSDLQCAPFKPNGDMPSYLLGLGERTVNVTLSGGTQEGDNILYAFLLNVITPEALTAIDYWKVRILDKDLVVVDSALSVVPPRFEKDLEMGNPSLAWLQPPQKGEVSVVSVEVSFLRRVKSVQAVLISLPENYRHDIQHKNQLSNVNRQFPVAIDIEWRVYNNLRWVKVLIEVSAGGNPSIIPGGTYQWQFPVTVPVTQPFATEWYVTLCKDYNCVDLNSPNLVASFPIPNNEPQMPARVYEVVATTGGAEALCTFAPVMLAAIATLSVL
eukprot:TRINITY_DN27909_c0_g1_i1.p1 TRINITY_DN27909_c0_g1~~TRINITY_DN27909_c0_g1_i1.p1  ORF type:complete len:3513 (-),score=559.98 TRINITY_DN27909_c0_g1_i1:29-9340(-)